MISLVHTNQQLVRDRSRVEVENQALRAQVEKLKKQVATLEKAIRDYQEAP